MRWVQPLLEKIYANPNASDELKQKVSASINPILEGIEQNNWRLFYTELKNRAKYDSDVTVLPTAESIGEFGFRCMMLDVTHYDVATKRNVSAEEEAEIRNKYMLLKQCFFRLPLSIAHLVFDGNDFQKYTSTLNNQADYSVNLRSYTFNVRGH